MTASAGPALRQLHAEFSDRVAFVTLYVREAHPGERYPQPATFETKLRHARDYKTRDAIPWPVAVDDVDGRLHRALDGKPNAAYLVDTDGRVAFRALWSNTPSTLRIALTGIVSRQPLRWPEDESKIEPMLRGMGQMRDTLRAAGRGAEWDVLRAAPPLYAMAQLASLFRPLPPLGRGIAAVATTVTLVVLAVSLGRRGAAAQARPRGGDERLLRRRAA